MCEERGSQYAPGTAVVNSSISLGLTELQRRSSERFAEESLRLAKSTKWVAVRSMITSLLAGVVALGIAVYSVITSNRMNKDWQGKQLEVLEEISEGLKK